MLEANQIKGDIYYPASGFPVPADHVYENGIVRYDKNLKSLYFSELMSERLLMLNHPALWKKVLTKYPNLKIISQSQSHVWIRLLYDYSL